MKSLMHTGFTPFYNLIFQNLDLFPNHNRYKTNIYLNLNSKNLDEHKEIFTQYLEPKRKEAHNKLREIVTRQQAA